MSYDLTLYNYLKPKLKVCRLTGKKDETIIRCIFCGDSAKDPFKGHMYIQNKAPFKYYCQRCTSKGIVNQNFLLKLNVTDYELIAKVNKSLADYQKKLSYKYGNEINYFNNKVLDFLPKAYTGLENSKIKYVQDRLGIELEEDDLDRYKMIVNFKDFLQHNRIDISKRVKTPRDNELFAKLQNHCVGFLSTDKNTIVFRSLDEDKTGFRYHNYSLFPDAIDSKKFYSIKKKIDLSLSEHKIIMTEGILDIIGVYNHIFNKDDEPLYISNNGKSFLFVLDYLASLSLLNVDIEIYSDKDVNLKFYEYVMKENKLAKFNGINVFYNQIDKDYGVMREKIKLSQAVKLI
jgi:hypothetical protein